MCGSDFSPNRIPLAAVGAKAGAKVFQKPRKEGAGQPRPRGNDGHEERGKLRVHFGGGDGRISSENRCWRRAGEEARTGPHWVPGFQKQCWILLSIHSFVHSFFFLYFWHGGSGGEKEKFTATLIVRVKLDTSCNNGVINKLPMLSCAMSEQVPREFPVRKETLLGL